MRKVPTVLSQHQWITARLDMVALKRTSAPLTSHHVSRMPWRRCSNCIQSQTTRHSYPPTIRLLWAGQTRVLTASVPQENATVQTEIRAIALAHRFSAICHIWNQPRVILYSWSSWAVIITLSLARGKFQTQIQEIASLTLPLMILWKTDISASAVFWKREMMQMFVWTFQMMLVLMRSVSWKISSPAQIHSILLWFCMIAASPQVMKDIRLFKT